MRAIARFEPVTVVANTGAGAEAAAARANALRRDVPIALEVANGIEEGSTPVIVLITETAEAMFHTGDYKGAPRVVGGPYNYGQPGAKHVIFDEAPVSAAHH